MKNRFFNNIVIKDVKEFNIIFLLLIGLILIGVSGYSSYAIFSDEIISNNEIKGVIKMVNLDKSGANAPVLSDNMIPVYYDSTNSVWKKADVNNKDENYKWYDYDKKQWANVATVSETNRSAYLSAEVGSTIPMEEINTMWVWIPRYKYTYFSSSTPVEIPITFEKGIESTDTISCVDAISANSGKSENCTDTTNGSLTVGKSTYTHPAFTFGDEELTGIWVGKFENTVNGSPFYLQIKPGELTTLYADATLDRMFKYSRDMELSGNVYGFSQDGTTLNTYTGEISGDSNYLDTHVMKNMEWGAAAYFAHSKYGLCSNGVCNDIGINNINGGITGYGEPAGSSSTNSSANFYNTANGMLASTTGNIYGIYDMSGGTWEYVMGNMYSQTNLFNVGSAKIWASGVANKPLDKYYDKYSYGDSRNDSNAYKRGKLGDATIEMQPAGSYNNWYKDYALFPYQYTVWFGRGGYYHDADNAGLFHFYPISGDIDSTLGFRSVLVINPS